MRPKASLNVPNSARWKRAEPAEVRVSARVKFGKDINSLALAQAGRGTRSHSGVLSVLLSGEDIAF